MGPEIWVPGPGSEHLGPNIWVHRQHGSKYMGPNIWVWVFGSGYLCLGIWVWVYGSEHMGPGSKLMSNLIFMCLVSLDPDPE